MAKDKYRNIVSGSGSGVGGDTVDAIVSTDKDLMATSTAGAAATAAKASIPINSVRGSSYATTAPLPGGLHISKQQFQQQLQKNRSKR